MPLTRYQIRNEFSLADPELYGAADKDDPEALLEGVAMAGLVGVLRQLGDLAEFAAEIFHDLHEEVMVTSARGHGLMARVQQLEADFPSMEKAFLSQTSHSSFFYNTGMDWHPNLHMDQNLIMQKDLPRFVMDSYEECRGPPRLFLLDKFDIAGAGACLKRYTDPSLFKVESSSYGMANSEVHREKKNRKVKKKGSRWKNGETPEVLPTSHAKLHQLFLEERVESGISDPARRVKLKRRLNGFPFDTKSGKSYMEKFLETSSPDHKVVHEISVSSSPKRLPSNVTYDSGLEILDISVVSEDEESKQRMRSPSYSPNVEGIVRRPLMDGNGEDFTDHNVLDGPEPISSFGTDKVTSRLHKAVGEKDITIDGGSQAEGSVDGYQSDGNASEIDNYMDALATIELEMETESERRANSGMSFLNAEMQGTDSDGNEEQLLSHFSDSQSIGHSTTSDDWNSLAKKNISSFSSSDSPSTSTENTPLDDAPSVSAKVFTSSETRDSEIIYKSSEDPSNDQEVSVDQVPNHIFSGSESLEVGDIPIEGAESGEPCSSSCLMNSGTIEQEGMVVKPDLDEVMPKCDTVNTESVNSENSGRNINDSLPGTSDLPHASIAFAEKHPVDEYADEIQNAYSDNISIPLKKKSENSLDDGRHEEYANEEYAKNGFTKDLIDSQGSSPNLVISHTEGKFLDPEVETCDPDIKPNDEVSEANKAVPSAVEIEDSTPAVDSPATPNFTMQAVAEITGDNKLHELDSAEEVACYSTESDVIEAEAYSEKHFEEISETTPKMDVLGFDERKTEVAQLESLAVSVAGAGAGPLDDAGGVDGSSPSMDATNFQNESFFNQSVSDLEVNDTAQACVPQNNVEQVNKFTDASPDLDSSLCRTDSGHHPESEILNSVLDSSLDSEVKNDSHLDGDSIVPSSSENRALDSESNSSSKACLIEDSEVKNDSHLDGDSIVPSSSENRALDSESNASSKACLIENTVDGDAPSPALLKAPCPESVISSIVSIDLSESEFLNANMSPSSETNAWEQVNLIGKGEDVSSLPVHHFAETSVPSEQNVVSESLHPIAWKQANLPETNTWEQANLIEKGEDVSSLPGHHFEETSVPSEQNVVSESLYPIESCSESFFKLEQMKSSIEMDQESFLPDLPGHSSLSELLPEPDTNKPDMSEQATNSSRPAFASFSLLPVATFDEMPPMPPLPPVQWIMGKLQPASQEERNTIHPNVGPVPSEMPSAASGEKIIQSSNPFMPPPTSVKDENFEVPFGHFSLETTNVGNIENGHDDFLPSDRTQSRNPFLELPETQLETPEPGLHTGSSGAMQPSSISSSPVTTPNGLHTSSCGTMQPSSISQSTVTTTNVDATSTYTSEFSHGNSFQPPHNVPPETSLRDEKLECSSSGISEIEEVKPDNAIVPPTMEDEQAQPIFPISKREIAWPYAEEGKPNEIRPTKLLRPRSPFIDAVAAHDKTKLRKVSERVRPEVQKVEERDSLLEQIRTKSFNLKPAAMARPPSFQGPRTNLRVAALLEKANAIRQAFAGSDEDEDDDSWSDS